MKTVEAVIDEAGEVRLLETVHLKGARRALVTILEEPTDRVAETALLSEPSLAEAWPTPEEEDAWSHLQPVR